MSDDAPVLTSPRNPQVVAAARLHQVRHRRGSGLTLVEGPHQVDDVLAAGADVQQVFVAVDDPWAPAAGPTAGPASGAGRGGQDRPQVRITRVSEQVLRTLAGTEHPRGPVAVVAEPVPGPLLAVDTVVLWDVSDPGNVGAIARSAAAFGWAVAVTAGTADPWSPKVVRASAASLFRTSLTRLGARPLVELEDAGLHPVAAVSAGGVDPETLVSTAPMALLIGNEAHGLPPDVSSSVTALTIPLRGGVESLNAAAAAVVAMYALRRSAGPADTGDQGS